MASWEGWKEIGGATLSGPAACGGHVDLFVRGTDYYVHHTRLEGATFPAEFEPWTRIPDLLTSAAPAATVHNGSVYVFAVADGSIRYCRRSGSTLTGWQQVPGRGFTDIGVTAGVLVARTDDGLFQTTAFDGSGAVLSFRGWRTVDDGFKSHSAPAITQFGAGYHLFLRGLDDAIWFRTLGADRVSWGAWREVPGGGRTTAAPAAAAGLLAVRGTDDALHYNSFDGGFSWTGWRRVPGGLSHDAPALAHAGGFFTLAVRGTNNGVYYNMYD